MAVKLIFAFLFYISLVFVRRRRPSTIGTKIQYSVSAIHRDLCRDCTGPGLNRILCTFLIIFCFVLLILFAQLWTSTAVSKVYFESLTAVEHFSLNFTLMFSE